VLGVARAVATEARLPFVEVRVPLDRCRGSDGMTMVSRRTRRVHPRDRKYGDDKNKVACVCNHPNQSQQGKGKEKKKAKDVEKGATASSCADQHRIGAARSSSNHPTP